MEGENWTAVNKTDISEFTWATKDVVRNVKWNGGKDNLYVEADYATKSRIYYGDDEDETEALFHVAKKHVGTLTLKDKTGHVFATMNVSMTKELAKKGPEGFSIKTAQLNEAGIWNAYLIPVESKTGFEPKWTYDKEWILILFSPA